MIDFLMLLVATIDFLVLILVLVLVLVLVKV
jgi:hypothetical protein